MDRRLERTEEACKILQFIEEKYPAEIDYSKKHTAQYKEYASDADNVSKECNPEVLLWAKTAEDSATFIAENCSVSRICILNFASYKHPGGGFLKGVMAQEESLCYVSTLFPVLKHFKDFYKANADDINHSLYRNSALYSEDILFSKDTEFYCDVLSCAAPNFRNAKIQYNVTPEENKAVLEDRIQFMYSIFNKYELDDIILGAWGCGVFGQPAGLVAELMLKYVNRLKAKRVIFAVPNAKGENFLEFAHAVACRK